MKVIVGYISETREPFASLLPIGCGYIHAALRASGHDSLLVNFSGMNEERRVATLCEHRPRILFLSQLTHNRHHTAALAAMAKRLEPGCIVVLGGPHASFTWQDILAHNLNVDAVVIGEGEQACRDIVTAVMHAKPIHLIPGVAARRDDSPDGGTAAPLFGDLDDLPLPARYADVSAGFDLRTQLEFIITSRGCPASCSFCSSPSFWGKTIRYRSPASVVEEIRYLRDAYGLIYFSIRDDTFTCDRGRVIEICRKLLEERIFIVWNCQSRVNAVDAEVLGWMRRAGCEAIQYGVESGSAKVLKQLTKSLSLKQVREAARLTKDAGIRLSIYLITGVPGEDDGDLQETLRLIAGIQPDDGQVSPLVYYPGTRLFKEAVENRAADPSMFDSFNESFPVRQDGFAQKAMRQILRQLDAQGSSWHPGRFRLLRDRYGYCHVGNIIEGEYSAEAGDIRKAESLFSEIIRSEPDNPWGWLSLGELYAGQGDLRGAISRFRRLAELVPNHLPAHLALGELFGEHGQWGQAEEAFGRALELDPANEEAVKGVRKTAAKTRKAKR